MAIHSKILEVKAEYSKNMKYISVSESILPQLMSNKADGKERPMKKETEHTGKYLNQTDREALQRRKRVGGRMRCRQYMTVLVLLAWDGLLLYMIVNCLIDGICGAVFMAVISVDLGYHLK